MNTSPYLTMAEGMKLASLTFFEGCKTTFVLRRLMAPHDTLVLSRRNPKYSGAEEGPDGPNVKPLFPTR